MPIKIAAIGTGLAAILGAGSVLLAALGNVLWGVFLQASILALIVSIILRKL